MYSFSIQVDADFEVIESSVVAALAEEGFGVLTEIDVQATMKKKLGLERLPYKILGACNPTLAHQAIEAEPDIGLLLPCNVVLRSLPDGEVVIAFMDPEAVMSLVQRDDVASLAAEVRNRLQRVSDKLQSTFSKT